MELVYQAVAVISILGVGLYTLHYARWCFRRQFRVAAVGLTLLAGLTVALPMWLLFVPR